MSTLSASRLLAVAAALTALVACSSPTGPAESRIHELSIEGPDAVTQHVGTSVPLLVHAWRYVGCSLELCGREYVNVTAEWRTTNPEVAAIWTYATGKRARLLAEGSARIIARARGLSDTLYITVLPRQ